MSRIISYDTCTRKRRKDTVESRIGEWSYERRWENIKVKKLEKTKSKMGRRTPRERRESQDTRLKTTTISEQKKRKRMEKMGGWRDW